MKWLKTKMNKQSFNEWFNESKIILLSFYFHFKSSKNFKFHWINKSSSKQKTISNYNIFDSKMKNWNEIMFEFELNKNWSNKTR